jgi:membrane protease YdiL (CAAX protease family)
LRVPAWLGWVLLLLTFFTAGLLRQFHDRTPRAPHVSPLVGSLLFAGIFLLLLVAAREWRSGAVPGRGVRLGSLVPIMLMLLVEKWASLTAYEPIFVRITPAGASPGMLDAQFRTLAGVGLILVCLLVSRFSIPTARKTWRRARPLRFPAAAVGTVLVVSGTYLLLGLFSWSLGAGLRLDWPEPSPLLLWILGGQALLAFAEELYYRGLLMSEMERLAPRLGARNAVARRWTALIVTSVLFGMEHIHLQMPWDQLARQLVFTVCLGTLFGLLVMVSANIHFGAGVHAWINWLLLGAAPYFVDGTGRPALPPGTYIGLVLILSFVLSYLYRRVRHRHSKSSKLALSHDTPAG